MAWCGRILVVGGDVVWGDFGGDKMIWVWGGGMLVQVVYNFKLYI